MKTDYYLIVTGNIRRLGVNGKQIVEPGTLEVRRKKPRLDSNQIAIKVNLEIPDALFLRPALELDVRLPEPEQELRVSPEFEQRITEAVAEAAGERVHVRVTAGEKEENR